MLNTTDQINTSFTKAPEKNVTESISPIEYGEMVNSNMAKLNGTEYPNIYDETKPDLAGYIDF